MRTASAFVLLAVALLFGCSGGGSSSGTDIQEQVQSFPLGLLRGDVPTTMSLSIKKPFHLPGTVELAEAPTGAFQPAAGTLPMPAASGPEVSLWLTFTPPGAPAAALQEGTIRLLFRRTSGEAVPVTLLLQAQIETPSARLMQTQVPAGNAALGETVRFGVYVQNTSAVTPITVTGVTLPPGEFSIDPAGPALPMPVAAGSRFYLGLLYAPEGEWNATSLMRVHHSAAAEPLEATLAGTGIAPLVVFDYGPVPLDPVSFESGWLALDVPAEAVSISLEAWGDPAASVIDLIGFEGPSGAVYETYDLTGPLGWLSSYPAGARGYLNILLPDSDLPAVQLVRGGGTYRFRLRDSAFATGELNIRATVSQRAGGVAREGTLDLRVFLADGLAIADRSDPMSDPKLAATMKTVDAILGMSAIRLGTISFSFLDPAYNTLADETETEDLLAVNTNGLPEGPLNVFFVSDMSYGVAGVAGAVPGPRANGTPYSGVVIDFGPVDGITVGAIAAYEIGQYLGHLGAEVVLPPNEAYPVLRHPLLNPGLPQDLLSPPESTNSALILAMIDMMAPMGTWSPLR